MNVRPKNYSWPEFYDNVISLTRYTFSWRAIARRFTAMRGAIPRWMNVVRAVSSEGFGRIAYYTEVRRGPAALVRLQDPQDVASEDPLELVLRVPTSAQLGGEPRQLGGVLHSRGNGGDAVEVAAEAGVVGPGDLDDVVDVVGDAREGDRRQGLRAQEALRLIDGHRLHLRDVLQDRLVVRLVEEPGEEVHADRAAVVPHRLDHGVRHVPGHVRESAHGGVRGDHRLLHRAHRVPEERIRRVRDVHDDAQPIHLLEHPAAERGQSYPMPRIGGRTADGVRDRPGERHVAHAELRESAQVLELLLLAPRQQRVPSLQPEQHAEHAARGVRAHLRRRPRQGYRGRVLAQHRLDG